MTIEEPWIEWKDGLKPGTLNQTFTQIPNYDATVTRIAGPGSCF